MAVRAIFPRSQEPRPPQDRREESRISICITCIRFGVPVLLWCPPACSWPPWESDIDRSVRQLRPVVASTLPSSLPGRRFRIESQFSFLGSPSAWAPDLEGPSRGAQSRARTPVDERERKTARRRDVRTYTVQSALYTLYYLI